MYGQGGAPTPGTGDAPVKLVAMPPGSMLLLVTADAVVLKQLTEFWWWFDVTTELSGLTGHGKVLVPSGDGTLVAQLLYEYELYSESVSANGCMNCVPKPFLKSAAATAAAFMAFRSRFLHLARRFLNHTWG